MKRGAKKNLEFIKRALSAVNVDGMYKGRQCVNNRVEFYESQIERLHELREVNLINHSFATEVRRYSEQLEHDYLVEKLHDKVTALERHEYAPEMNKLYFRAGVIISVPGKFTISDALKSLSIDQLRNI